jgi:SAM-dependent methyltransferase
VAITAIEYSVFRSLRAAGKLPLGGDILQLGEANWYGDVGLNDLREDIGRHAPEAERPALLRELDRLIAERPSTELFDIARIFWATFFQPRSMTAIDFHGSADALKLDLNGPVDLGRRFDVVMNLGTIEHVFNVAQALATMHDHTAPGGIMIHGMPLTGWVDHGFYNFHSTFYWDLARANDYQVVVGLHAQLEPLKIVQLKDRETILELARDKALGDNSLIYMILRRPAEVRPFKAPIQGYYAADAVSPEAARQWKALR